MPVNDDILFVAMEDWDEVWRRNQPIAAEFARRVPARKLLYMGLPIDLSHSLRKLSLTPLRRALSQSRRCVSPEGFPNIVLFNPVKWLPNTLPFGQRFNRWLERRQLRRACKRIGLQNPILWLNPHYGLHLLGKVSESLVVYDIGDDWTQIKQAEWLRLQTVAEDAELCRRADVLIVVSERLQQLKSGLRPQLYRIPNGVYVERYAGIANRSLPPHPATSQWTHPVLAYTGTIHDERVNLDLIEKIASAFPDATLALVGPSLLNDAATARLKAHKNIRMPGTFPFDEMPRVMSAFDVCIVPHAVPTFTESLSPLKLYEYLASGLPAVATPVPGFRDFPELVYLAADAPAFIAAIKTALCEPGSLQRSRQAAAAFHSWEARMKAIEAAIETQRANSSSCQQHQCSPSLSSATILDRSR
jgi:glycosyltransferase involved in cell wall biosynthesis